MEASLQNVEYVAATILYLYEFEKMDFRKGRRILEKANRVAYVNRHNEIYGLPEKLDKPLELKKVIPQEEVEKSKTPEIVKKSVNKKSKEKKKDKEKKEKSKEKKKEKKNKKKKYLLN